jgi:hypothetical protein
VFLTGSNKSPNPGGAHAITSRHDFEQQGPLKERDYLKRIYQSRDAEMCRPIINERKIFQ